MMCSTITCWSATEAMQSLSQAELRKLGVMTEIVGSFGFGVSVIRNCFQPKTRRADHPGPFTSPIHWLDGLLVRAFWTSASIWFHLEAKPLKSLDIALRLVMARSRCAAGLAFWKSSPRLLHRLATSLMLPVISFILVTSNVCCW